jgi:DNA ligase 1
MFLFKPMLAGVAGNVVDVNYPMLASPKIQGVRAVVRNGVLVDARSRPIPNLHVQKMFSSTRLNGLDGMLVLGTANRREAFADTQAAVVNPHNAPIVTFYVFDYFLTPLLPFRERHQKLYQIGGGHPHIKIVDHIEVADHYDAEAFERLCLNAGYAGVILRKSQMPYKYGQSTPREGALLNMRAPERVEEKL